MATPPNAPEPPRPPRHAPDAPRPDVIKVSDPRPSADTARPRPSREGPETTCAVPPKTATRNWPLADQLDLRLPPKPPSLPPKPPSPRKRLVDADDDSRPLKRPRPDDARPPARDDAHRRRDRPLPSTRDAPAPREDRLLPASSSSLPNGRPAVPKGAASAARGPSPAARARPDSVNGARPNPAPAGKRATPTKSDASKAFVPPLLSPLNIALPDLHDQSRSRAGPADDGEAAAPRERKKREAATGDGSAAPKVKKAEPPPPPSSKKNRVAIPPLLSPTLPPIVEAALRRRKKALLEPAEDAPKDGSRDAPAATKKRAAAELDEEPPKLVHRRRLVVSLSIPKNLRAAVKKILAQHPGRKDAVERDRDRDRDAERDRDRAGSDDALQAPQARKRPAGATDGVTDSVASKRPRTSEAPGLSRTAATPSTPSRKSTAPSRVSSSNWMAQTPGEGLNATPTASADRRPNGQDAAAGAKPDRQHEIKVLNEKEDRLRRKAKNLKHDADLIMRSHRSPNATSMKGRPGEAKIKYAYVLTLEGIIAFVMSFQAMNLALRMSSRRYNHTSWQSMLPLLDFLQGEMRRDDLDNCKPPLAVLLLMHAVCLDELLKCYASFDNAASLIKLEDLLSLERRRARLWSMVRDVNAGIDDAGLRVAISAWYSIDEVTDAALRVLRRWCDEERVDWTPEPVLAEYWPVQRGHA